MATYQIQTESGVYEIETGQQDDFKGFGGGKSGGKGASDSWKPESELTKLLSSSDPVQPTGDPLMDKLIFAQKEIASPIAQGANTALFGVPKYLMEKIGGKEFAKQAFSEQSTKPGKVLRFGSEATGLIGGGIGRTTANVGKRLVPKGAGLAQRILGGAAQGAVGGVLMPTEDFTSADQRVSNLTQGAVMGGLLGGILPSTSPKVAKTSKKEDIAGRLVNSIIKPAKNQFSYGKNPGLAVAKEGIVANSVDDLYPKISSALDKRTSELTNVLKKSKNKISIEGFTKPIDEAIDAAGSGGPVNNALIQRLQDTKIALLNEFKVANGKAEIVKPRNLKNISPEDATMLKRLVGQLTKWTGTSDDNAVNAALKKSYSGIKKAIEKAEPATKEINNQIANLISAESAVSNRLVQQSKNNLFSMSDMLFGIGGAGTLDSITGGLATVGVKRALTSPAFLTRVASFLAKAPAKEKVELFRRFPQLRNQLMTSGVLGGSEIRNSGKKQKLEETQ